MPVTEAQLPFLEGRGIGAIATAETSEYLWLSWLVIYSIAHVLAFSLIWFSRYIFLISFAVSVLMAAVGGISVGTPWDNTAWSVHSAIATFAIGMLFFSPAARSGTRRDYAAAAAKKPLSGPAVPIAYPPDGR